ncbi:cell cycle checkpoint control protein RAD9B isoform 2-T2 [Guaruba guarouba]
MKCVIGGARLRVFGRAIHAMARISDEFWFDPLEKGLALRSVNSSRSAYAYVFFSSMFFQHYCWAAVPQPHQKEKQSSSPLCKLIIKSVLPVFRSVNVLERNVEKCTIYTNINDHHITFQFFCKHGVVKTYNLTFQECDPLQAVFAKHMCPNVLKLHSRLLADILIHFPMSQEEVTLSVTPVKVCFKSYTGEDTDFSKTMLTEIQLNPDEFDYFQVGVDSEVTFCLKELRGLLTFSEATSVPVSIHFDISGNLETCTGKAEKASMDKDSSTQANASKKPQGSGTTLSMEPAKPGSPLVKQRKVILGAREGDATGAGGATTAHAALAGEAAEAHYDKFHSLFFGAVSCKEKDAVSHTFHSLATDSDTEEDFGNVQSSPVL